jgi:hypothetical protein
MCSPAFVANLAHRPGCGSAPVAWPRLASRLAASRSGGTRVATTTVRPASGRRERSARASSSAADAGGSSSSAAILAAYGGARVPVRLSNPVFSGAAGSASTAATSSAARCRSSVRERSPFTAGIAIRTCPIDDAISHRDASVTDKGARGPPSGNRHPNPPSSRPPAPWASRASHAARSKAEGEVEAAFI